MLLDCMCCPSCGGAFEETVPDICACADCSERYPIKAGIPDLRWPPVPPDSEHKAQVLVERLLAGYSHLTFGEMAGLVSQSLAMSSGLVSMHLNYMLDLERGNRLHAMFVTGWCARYGALPYSRELALDLGCGTGKGLSALAKTYRHVIGLDAGLPGLILARKVVEEKGLRNVTLVQGYAQRLPLRDNAVGWCQAQNVLDHLFQVTPAFREVRRVLRPGGAFCADSHNRYDLFFKEPHVQLRGVGWLPRAWMAPYVRARTGESYESVWLLSIADVHKALREAFDLDEYQVSFPDVAAYGHSARWNRLLGWLQHVPLLRSALLAVFPSHLVVIRKSPLTG